MSILLGLCLADLRRAHVYWLPLGIGASFLTACDPSSVGTADTSPQPSRDAAADAAPVDGGPDAKPVTVDATLPELRDATVTLRECEPGRYEGTYTCENDTAIIREGKLALELVVDEQEVDAGSGCVEFCSLVIKQGSGAIEGEWAGLFSFEGPLEGGLDCRSGDFRATVTDGLWGPPNLPVGTFHADFDGAYDADAGSIEGESEISPDGVDGCTGEIKLHLRP